MIIILILIIKIIFKSSLIESLSCSKGEFDEHEQRIKELEKENGDLKEEFKLREASVELREELELEKSIATELEGHVTKHRRQIEELLGTIDMKDARIGQLREENDELKKAVNSIYAYLSNVGVFHTVCNHIRISKVSGS